MLSDWLCANPNVKLSESVHFRQSLISFRKPIVPSIKVSNMTVANNSLQTYPELRKKKLYVKKKQWQTVQKRTVKLIR